MEGYLEWALGRTWYRVVGDLDASRAPLLALHGGPGSTHHYFAPLERLADERAVVVFDQLGCGASDRPSDVEWSVQVFLDELAALRDELGLRRIHLLGTSWGGMLALEHALSAGGLASLVLSSTLASAEEWVREVRRLREAVPEPDDERAEEILFDRHFYRGPKPRAELDLMLPQRGREAYRAMWGPNEWTVTGALRDWDVRPRLGEIDVPTLVVRGAHDLSTDAVSRTLVDGIRGARYVVLEESSHTPVLEETDRYLDVVAAFLREND